jgi:hypothetical protein
VYEDEVDFTVGGQMIRIRKPARRIALGCVLALVIAACGGDEAGEDTGLATLEPETTTPVVEGSDGQLQAEEAVLEFAECMRENGFPQFPDPEIDSDGQVTFDPSRFEGIDPQSEEVRAAFDVCSVFIDGVALAPGGLNFADPEFQDQLLALAQCLRDEGLEVDDPNFSTFDPTRPGSLFGDSFDPLDPDAQAAIQTCVREVGFFGPGQAPPPTSSDG